MTNSRNAFYLGCRLLLGLFFVFSAILKWISIDAFELYVYSFEFVNLSVSSWLSRILVFSELSSGLLLISTFYKKQVDLFVTLQLAGFSVFLAYLIAIGHDGNCHCMGEAFDISAKPSLIKNLFLFALLFFASKAKSFRSTQENLVSLILFLSAATFSFLKPPIGIVAPKETTYNQEEYRKLAEEYPMLKAADEKDNAIVCFFSVKCKHCKMAMKKLEVCLKHKPNADIQWVVWGDSLSLRSFMEENRIEERPHFFLSPMRMMPVTEYNIPLFLFMKKGEVVEKMSNSTFDDEIALRILEIKK